MKKHHITSITFIANGLILQLIYFFILLPLALNVEAWLDIILPLYFFFFLLSVLEIIFGFYNLIKKNTKNHHSYCVAVINVCIGFLFIVTWYGLILFLSGSFIIFYLEFIEED